MLRYWRVGDADGLAWSSPAEHVAADEPMTRERRGGLAVLEGVSGRGDAEEKSSWTRSIGSAIDAR